MSRTRLFAALSIGVGLALAGLGLARAFGAGETTGTQTFTNVVTYTIPTVTQTVTQTVTGTTTAAPPPPACSSQAFCGDYETGDFSQWDGHQWTGSDQGYTCSQVGNTSATIVPTAAQGLDAARFVVNPSGCTSSQRAEVYSTAAKTGGNPGEDHYYGWWTMFPSSGNTGGFWASGGDFNVFTQFHGPGSAGAQEALGVDATSGTPRLYFEVDTRQNGGSDYQKWLLGNLAFDHWYHFVAHIKWATDSSGYVELTVDGSEVVPQTAHQTLYPITGASAYWKQGFYRGSFSATNTVYHDGACRADSFTAAAAC